MSTTFSFNVPAGPELPPLNPTSIGIDLALLGPHLLVPFEAVRLPAPRVVWLNKRAWLAAGVDTRDATARRMLEEWLIDQYAFVTDDGIVGAGERATFYADRYGATDGAAAGGSGRCGIRGTLNVKGVGRTPLVGDRVSVGIHHSHGSLWLDEAMREALFSELCAREAPFGVVPTLAVIDCGLEHHIPEWRTTGRRALLIRPNFVRLAHMQRSIYFGSAGFPGSAQHIDAMRAKDAVQRLWFDGVARKALGVTVANLEETVSRLAEQVAFLLASRLYVGGLNAANVTINGELVDFGGVRTVQGWQRTRVADGLPLFGDDPSLLGAIFSSLSFYREKYGRASNSPPRIGLAPATAWCANLIGAALERRFNALSGSFDPALQAQVARALLDFFSQQQRRRQAGGSFSDTDLPATGEAAADPFYDQVLEVVEQVLGRDRTDPDEVVADVEQATLWARSRVALSHENIVKSFHDVLYAQDQSSMPAEMDALFDHLLSTAHRDVGLVA